MQGGLLQGERRLEVEPGEERACASAHHALEDMQSQSPSPTHEAAPMRVATGPQDQQVSCVPTRQALCFTCMSPWKPQTTLLLRPF